MRMRYLLLAIVPLMAACSTTDTKPAADSNHVTNFICEDGTFVEASYPSTDEAQLRINGRIINLRSAISASGARYVGEGWEWWTKGMVEGTLTPLSAGEDNASAAGTICSAQP